MEVKKVFIVSKTHLDVGFTDYAQNVLNKYVSSFIPKSVNLAFRLNTPEKKLFVWTTGAYLIKYALEHSPEEDRKNLEKAIEMGYVRYHALPLTTHSELLSKEIFSYGISIAKELDRKFGLHTIAAKMTDVPGHTKSIVPIMADMGIKYLHLGVNSSSRVPKTPEIFRWQSDGKEIVVSYSGDYAKTLILPNGCALEILHTHDNFGPPSESEISLFYEKLRKKYPQADIEAGTLDDFAYEIEKVKECLPVVSEEIGDTWIHGIATDPKKVSEFKRLSALADKWIDGNELIRGSKEYNSFMENMLLVAEHTWGMDVKKHLLDFQNWSKKDFTKALKEDNTDYSFYGTSNKSIFEKMLPELQDYRGNNDKSSYSIFAKSHEEQRLYISKALNTLPKILQTEAKEQFEFAFPEEKGAVPFSYENTFCINDWIVMFDKGGYVSHISNSEECIDRKVEIGKFLYESFSGKTVQKCFFDYGRDLKENYHWAVCDFGKPGLENEYSVKDGLWASVPEKALILKDSITVFFAGAREACENYGCPRRIAIEYRFSQQKITVTVFWKDKDPIRSPEALWFCLDMSIPVSDKVRLKKSGSYINPLEVVSGGNRKLHAVEEVVCIDSSAGFSIRPIDSPLVSIGGRHLYNVDNRIEDSSKGLYFLLYNNRWGTNFPQWYSEDGRASFEIFFPLTRRNR